MNNPSILEKTAVDLIVALRNGEISSFELAKAFIDRTDKVDEKVNAFLHRDDENFLKQAREADKRRENGKQLGILDGLPVSLKDVISVKDQPLTAASKILEPLSWLIYSQSLGSCVSYIGTNCASSPNVA